MANIPPWWSVFANEYVKNGNHATHAYLKAKPKCKPATASVQSCRLLKNPNFNKFFTSLLAKIEKKVEMSREEWFRLTADIARFDVRNFLKARPEGDIELADDWKNRADGHALEEILVQSTTLESGAVVNRVKIKAAAKLKALETLGKALGYLNDSGASSDGVTILIVKEEQAVLPRTVEIEARPAPPPAKPLVLGNGHEPDEPAL